MQKVLTTSLVLFILLMPGNAAAAGKLTDAQVKNKMINESIDNYSGSCPCPYNTARNGSSCGGRSAYSRAGGYETICYPKDVTPAMIKEYRANH